MSETKTCTTCNGKGYVRCPRCHGSGKKNDGGTCDVCYSSGSILLLGLDSGPTGSISCDRCDGKGYVYK